MEGRPLVAEALLASSKGTKVLSGLGDGLAVEAEDDAAEGLAILLDIEVDLVGDLGALGGLGGLGEEDQADSEEEGDRNEKSAKVEHDCGFSCCGSGEMRQQ